jgi:hypothetical protein
MAIRSLDRSEWQGFFEGLERLIEGKQAEIHVASLALGDQIEANWLGLLGIAYDPKDDVLEIALDGVDHMIPKPKQIFVDVGPGGIENLEIIDGDDVRQLVRLREPLMLPAPAAT